MSNCHKCGLPVYFAERKTSLGKDWHRQCLQCEECGRVLNPGQHAEHRGLPYCHVPCYRALFGPTMYGHGSPVEAHNNFGSPQTRRRVPPSYRPDLEEKLKIYNEFYEGKKGILSSKEVNGRLVLDGLLRVYWGVCCPIQLKPKDNVPPQSHWRHSYALAINNGLDDGPPQLQAYEIPLDDHDPKVSNHHEEKPPAPRESAEHSPLRRVQTVTYRRKKPDRRIRKRYSINGHFYNQETCVFTPVHGTVTSVRVSSLIPTPEVIRLLLAKFKVLNRPGEFCLCTVRKSGETRVLSEEEFPLLHRVILGPLEDDVKIFIVDKKTASNVTYEVAQYAGLPVAVLSGFLQKLKDDEEVDIHRLKDKYRRIKQQLLNMLQQADRSSSEQPANQNGYHSNKNK